MRNLELRQFIKDNRVMHYEIAEKLGISEYTLCKRLRKKLSDEQRERIINAVKELRNEQGGEL